MNKIILYMAIVLSFFQIPGNLYMHTLLALTNFFIIFKKNGFELNFIKKTPYLLLLIMWFIYSLTSVIWSIDFNGWLRYNIVLFIAISYTISIRKELKSEIFLTNFFSIVILSGIIHNIIAWFEIITKIYLFNFDKEMVRQAIGHGNPLSFFNNTNDLAFFLMFLCTVLYFENINNKVRLPLIISSFIIIYKTDSRIMWVCVVLLNIIFVLFKVKDKKINRLIKILLISGVSILFISVLINNPLERINNDMSGNLRLNGILNGLIFLKNSTFLGVGPGNIPYYAKNFSLYPVRDQIQIHNWWAEILVSFGVLIFIMYIIFYFYNLLKSCKLSKEDKRFQLLTTWLVIFILSSIASSTIFPFIWVWISMGIIFEIINFKYEVKR